MDGCTFGFASEGVHITVGKTVNFYTCHWEGPYNEVNTEFNNARILIVGSRLCGILTSAPSGSNFTLINNRFIEKPDYNQYTKITDNTGSKFIMLANFGLSPAHFTIGEGTQYWPDALPVAADGTTETLHALSTNRHKNVIIAENTGTLVNRPEYVAKSDKPGIGFSETDGNENENYHLRVDNGTLHIGTNNNNYSAFGPKIAVQQDGNVGIGLTSPGYKLDVDGDIQAEAYHAGDIFFQKDGEKLWRMFEDEQGLYVESLKTGKKYSFMLQEIKDE
jgi:hypothetical protein